MVRANVPCRSRFSGSREKLPTKGDKSRWSLATPSRRLRPGKLGPATSPARRRRYKSVRCSVELVFSRRTDLAPDRHFIACPAVLEFLVVFGQFLSRDLHRHSDASRPQIFQDGLSKFQRDFSRRKN